MGDNKRDDHVLIRYGSQERINVVKNEPSIWSGGKPTKDKQVTRQGFYSGPQHFVNEAGMEQLSYSIQRLESSKVKQEERQNNLSGQYFGAGAGFESHHKKRSEQGVRSYQPALRDQPHNYH